MLFRASHFKDGSSTHWSYDIWRRTLCICGIVVAIDHILSHQAPAFYVARAACGHAYSRSNDCRSGMGHSRGCISFHNICSAVFCGSISSISLSQHSRLVALALWFRCLFHSVRRLVLCISESTLHCRASYLFGILYSSTRKCLLLVPVLTFRDILRCTFTDRSCFTIQVIAGLGCVQFDYHCCSHERMVCGKIWRRIYSPASLCHYSLCLLNSEYKNQNSHIVFFNSLSVTKYHGRNDKTLPSSCSLATRASTKNSSRAASSSGSRLEIAASSAAPLTSSANSSVRLASNALTCHTRALALVLVGVSACTLNVRVRSPNRRCDWCKRRPSTATEASVALFAEAVAQLTDGALRGVAELNPKGEATDVEGAVASGESILV